MIDVIKQFNKFWQDRTCIYGDESKWSKKGFKELRKLILEIIENNQ